MPRLPRASNGALNLTAWGADLAAGRTVPLTGTWVAYLGRILPPTGFATLRLDLTVPRGSPPLAISLPYVCSAYRLWANGQPVAGVGVVGTDRAAEVPGFRPTIADLPSPAPGSGTITLVLQVSNFHHRCGGLPMAPAVGSRPVIQRQQSEQRALYAALIGAVFAMAAYHLLLFAFWPSERANLPFAVFCLLALARVLVTGSMPLAWIWPGLPFGAQLRIEYVADYTTPLALLVYLQVLYPAEVSRWVVRIQALVAALGLLSLAWPLWESSRVIPLAALEVLCLSAYVVAAFGRAALRHREGALLLLLGAVPLALAIVHDELLYAGRLAGVELVPAGVLLFVFAQTGYLARRYAGAFFHLRQSHRVLIDSEERVRREIAERLHGPVQTQLLLAGQQLDEAVRALAAAGDPAADGQGTGVRDGDVRRLVEEARRRVDEVRDRDIRRVSHALHPTIVDIGLVPAIHSLAQQYAQRVAVDVDVAAEVEAMDAEMPSAIPDAVRLAVYRIVEEALANAHAHGGARRAAVRLALEPGHQRLLIQVRDDGRGLPAGRRAPASAGIPASGGLGLRIIASRVDALTGRWQLSELRKGGVVVEAVLPLVRLGGGGVEAAPPPGPDAWPADRPARPVPGPGRHGRRGRASGPGRFR